MELYPPGSAFASNIAVARATYLSRELTLPLNMISPEQKEQADLGHYVVADNSAKRMP
jgi:hypothetical protein